MPAKAGGEAEVDELAGLRELAVERGKGRGGEKPPKPEEKEDKDEAPTGEAKKKDKKKRRKKERAAEKAYEEVLEKKEEAEELERGQKTARALFSHTCLDPNIPRRKRLMKKARGVGKKRDKKRKRSDPVSRDPRRRRLQKAMMGLRRKDRFLKKRGGFDD